ncbi:MAG: hypothetical protein DMD91_10125 [Candidatus Rokuibacteriota bacterium]|nr:MAG: hypothetical protein DMD91_10125 [Candidatus Rokubacteria bacterium]
MRMQRLVIGWAIAVAAATTADAANGVTVQLFQFRPGNIAVATDTRVTWTNQDEIEHTITAGLPGRPDGAFDFTLGDKGATASFVFPKPGTYTYFCRRHQHMRGEVNVN